MRWGLGTVNKQPNPQIGDLMSEIGSCPVRAAITSVQLCQTKAFFQRRRSQSLIPK